MTASRYSPIALVLTDRLAYGELSVFVLAQLSWIPDNSHLSHEAKSLRTSRCHFHILIMEPLSEVDVEMVADSDQLIEGFFHYLTIKEYPIGCEEGKKRVIRRKAK